MKIVISPAKSLDFETKAPLKNQSDFIFSKEALQIQKTLKKKKPQDLSNLMSISEKLADLNWQRNQDWQFPFEISKSKQALYAFTGDVYLGLEANTIDQKNIEFAQKSLRILSGLYGVLKPFDMMLPYRLEMGTKLPIGDAKNL